MTKDWEVSLGWTCYSYILEIKQSFLVKMSALNQLIANAVNTK